MDLERKFSFLADNSEPKVSSGVIVMQQCDEEILHEFYTYRIYHVVDCYELLIASSLQLLTAENVFQFILIYVKT